eukprot:CAMPEP_0119303212 /NCGR_PEP_ID=MMETSP1333-20130426/4678_1 /TAXON_ID=418940 /ORGANISM="Scyphosphaera apsteinii, Strain RCC1455" /LENGTH=829 /DNA_ID=CAMNT_0007305819 /DNA_START=135 /DNA_END=2624 /DNA_ORIENTATION=+
MVQSFSLPVLQTPDARPVPVPTRAYRSVFALLDVASSCTTLGSTHTVSFEVAGKTMNFETGRIGRQASGAVVASMAESMVYSTVCIDREAEPVDFTPLRVDWFARYSAVGQTIGAFHRRDSRGDDTEILVARLIDRPLRPMIAEGWQHETQVLTHVLSYDRTHPLEALSICAASAAMAVSTVPMLKPIAGVEVGLVDGILKVNPTKQEQENSTLSLIMAGSKDGILMIEGEADFLPEEVMAEALTIGHTAIGVICDAINEFAAAAGKKKKLDTLHLLPSELLDAIDAAFGADLEEALQIGDKQERGKAVSGVEARIRQEFIGSSRGTLLTVNDDVAVDDDLEVAVMGEGEGDEVVVLDPSADEAEDEASELSATLSLLNPLDEEYTALDVKKATKKLLVRRLRSMILRTGKRSDGRAVDEVRPISIEYDLLPRAHGSSLFTRGETQVLATSTLGSKAMEARFENLDKLSAKSFYLQYRFPPSSVGEVGRVGGINRRETGHGNLAERALLPAVPGKSTFPYSIRAESLVTESCGSSSMASVCGSCLAMLDAGVPLKSHVAGVAMGLILGENVAEEPVILTDILGLEDALGTMDFKVAGNETGITTFQLDIKSEGLTLPTLKKALVQAKTARLHVLKLMREALDSPRKMKATIPRILEFMVPDNAIGKIIGPKGKTIQGLIDSHGVVNVNLEDTGSGGKVQVEGFDDEKNAECKEAIMKLVQEATAMDAKAGGRRGGRRIEDNMEAPKGQPPEDGKTYRDCKVVSVLPFGVFVEVTPGYEGLVHVSELDSKRVESPEKAGFKSGDLVDVKMLGRNDKGQMRLSRRAVLAVE